MTESGELIGGRYRLVEPVGQGGMGRVWRGLDETLDREVAIKEILFPPGLDSGQQEVLFRRVVREARAAARLNHPGIVTVHDVAKHQGAPTIVMEFISGRPLATAIREQGRLPLQRVVEIGIAVLGALQAAHAAGVVHRDLKPDNILLANGRIVLTDFGIASLSDATMALTSTGTILGTPVYMAPEQLEGKPATAAGDLWSLGATLYTAVEGQPPFTGPTFTSLCLAILTQDPRPADHAGALTSVLAELLTKDPAQRVTSEDATRALAALLPSARAPFHTQTRRSDTHPATVRSSRSGSQRARPESTASKTVTLIGHTGPVNSVAFSPDGSLLASASDDKSIRLWNIAAGTAEFIVIGHTGPVNSVAFSPDGSLLASASDDKSIRLWNIAAGTAEFIVIGHTGPVNSVAFSPDGSLLASASDDKTVLLWNIAGEITSDTITAKTLQKHTNLVNSVAFSPDGRTLASASWDRTVRLWDIATGKPVATLTGHSKAVFSVAFSPDGRTLASASWDRTVRLWDVAARKPAATLIGHTNSVNSVAFSPDGRTLASASWGDRAVRLWDAATGKPVATLTGHTDSVNSVAFGPGGRKFASASKQDKAVRLWDVATGKAVATLADHTQAVNSVAFSPDGSVLASAGRDKTVRLWPIPG
ncbi:WD40 repeat domain-containing serine/threonine protein kinase [Streptomyces polyrhachis]|uniref:WD40 repeat domain-containing serine/threonine protein kinase n=1 Tax=Streptomyces polyrhachis TaxID=1282885 RepID=A0ABW2GGZ8_9ACTN